MTYIEAPQMYTGHERSVFLAGGLSHTKNWQQELCDLLLDEPVVLFNPRRAVYPHEQIDAAKEQIAWEFSHLRKADAISFWFPEESVSPIALFELGAHTMTQKPIFIGVHPQYERRIDIEIQMSLVRPDITIVHSLHDLGARIREWVHT